MLELKMIRDDSESSEEYDTMYIDALEIEAVIDKGARTQIVTKCGNLYEVWDSAKMVQKWVNTAKIRD